MNTTSNKIKGYGRLILSIVLGLFLLGQMPVPAFAAHRDRNNNPPGPRGGRGTNWDNPPGPEGGPGASPYRRRDWDNNPPGPRGGRGTNWENPPGPRGGYGTSPDRRRDWDNNPPGPRGGAGTNWDNPPGPEGGPGASPIREHDDRYDRHLHYDYAKRDLEKLQSRRERLAAEGGSADRLGELDKRIAKLQGKIDEFNQQDR